MNPDEAIPVDLLEQETGLSREVVRKWELRYGFPSPQRDGSGARVYTADQVVRLRIVRRLLGAGARPGKVVGLDLAALEQMTKDLSLAPETSPSEFLRLVLDILARHDLAQLNQLLRGQLHRQGLALFVQETVSRLNSVVGEAWLRGDIKVFEEHLYTEVVIEIVSDAIRSVKAISGSPRLLLSTAPGELHTLGLMMVHALATLEGAECINLGCQTPATDVVNAARPLRIDIVGLSFSIAHSARDTASYLRDLRGRLDPAVEIWAGGEGASRLRLIGGVRVFRDLKSLVAAIRSWRSGNNRSA